MNKPTYIIRRSEIESVFSMEDYVSTVEKAFKLYGEGKVQMPSKVYMYFEKGDLRCMPVYIPPLGIAGVKNVNVHPQNKELPAVMATITIFDPENGFPLAIMDGTHITKMRTGAAGGVAAKYLSRNDSKVAAFIGTGEQAKTQLDALLITRPGISDVILYDINGKSAGEFAKFIIRNHKLQVRIEDSVGKAASAADIVVTTTPVRSFIVKKDDIKKGTHINAIGADAQGKQELDPEILKKAVVVIDNWEQASHSGEINVGISKGIIKKKHIYGDIGEIATGRKPGRKSDDQITIFDSTGLAIQDISSAWEIYKRLINDKKRKAKLTSINII
ncbi:MAG: ornithine cyclodeaminase family protein [Spirochaetes bacterium]|nr:ornithine cyclodeaminase family protein [Spirochaetota bacterium]